MGYGTDKLKMWSIFIVELNLTLKVKVNPKLASSKKGSSYQKKLHMNV